jgi:hypothetical protein
MPSTGLPGDRSMRAGFAGGLVWLRMMGVILSLAGGYSHEVPRWAIPHYSCQECDKSNPEKQKITPFRAN